MLHFLPVTGTLLFKCFMSTGTGPDQDFLYACSILQLLESSMHQSRSAVYQFPEIRQALCAQVQRNLPLNSRCHYVNYLHSVINRSCMVGPTECDRDCIDFLVCITPTLWFPLIDHLQFLQKTLQFPLQHCNTLLFLNSQNRARARAIGLGLGLVARGRAWETYITFE